MRLLNTHDLSLHEFAASDVPKYAIFSHTWGPTDDEVLFTDIDRGTAATKPAYNKICYATSQAVQHQLSWIWIDTCCIDKASSAELSEAINSMYKWYANATTCYAYLADVDDASSGTQLDASRWFKRGWTLQELIAPSSVIFFTQHWERVGTKTELHNELARITGVDVSILTGQRPLDSMSVAKRMSWASDRKTGRPEDIAYCLMGLFDVNMPMLYGEGEKAFLRLQEEIMKYSDDQSIFAWKDPDAAPGSYCGLLAKHPQNFTDSGNIVPYRDWEARTPFSMSNRGLRIDLHLSPIQNDRYIAALDCPANLRYEGFLGIYLQRLSAGDYQYARVRPMEFCQIHSRGNLKTVYVRQNVLPPDTYAIYPFHAIQLRSGPAPDTGCVLISSFDLTQKSPRAPVEPARARYWVGRNLPFAFELAKGVAQISAVLVFTTTEDRGSVIVFILGSTLDTGVGFAILVLPKDDTVPDRGELQRFYQEVLKPVGESIIVEEFRIRVSADPQVHDGGKYYMIDISIQPIIQTPAGIVPKLIHELSSAIISDAPSDEASSGSKTRRASKYVRSFWK